MRKEKIKQINDIDKLIIQILYTIQTLKRSPYYAKNKRKLAILLEKLEKISVMLNADKGKYKW